jgi:hypothetical protein
MYSSGILAEFGAFSYMTDIVQKLWGFCHTLRHDGVGYLVFTPFMRPWLDYIRAHFGEDLSVHRKDFEVSPVLERSGAWTAADRAFDGKFAQRLCEMNEAIAVRRIWRILGCPH